uniref:ORF55 n=1 Tax=Nitrosopumilaceae spindle-shaped virus TaxID=3065433 RepID=A0AAT9J7L7_9VIRU
MNLKCLFGTHDYRIQYLDYNENAKRTYQIICQRCDKILNMTNMTSLKEYTRRQR